MIGALLAGALQVGAVVDSTGVRLGVRVEPETVTVGVPFVVDVRVRASRGAQITFPAGPDSGAAVQALDPRVVVPSRDTTAAEATATYRLAAWDLGTQPLRLGNVTVQGRGGRGDPAERIRTIALTNLLVYVRATTPADSARRVPKPARGYLAIAAPWWPPWWWLLVALAVLLALWLLGRWWRRRARRGPAVLDPYAIALREFARIDGLGLLEAGERGRYVALVTEVLRDYLARRIDGATTALTSTELLAELQSDTRIPVEKLGQLLSESDLVKFARYVVTVDGARDLAQVARQVVTDVDAADHAARAAAASATATTRASTPPPRARAA